MKLNRGWADDAPGNEKGRKRRSEKPGDQQRDWSKPMPGDFIPMGPVAWLYEAAALSRPAIRLALHLCWRGAKDQYRPLVVNRQDLMVWGMTNRKFSETLTKMKPLLKIRPTSHPRKVKVIFLLPEEFKKRLGKRKRSTSSDET